MLMKTATVNQVLLQKSLWNSKELKKHVRGVRPLESALEGRTDEEAGAVRGYCLAVRSALTDDGKPPLDASGLKTRRS